MSAVAETTELLDEVLTPLADLATEIPPAGVSVRTLHRYVRTGVRGHRLAAVYVAGRLLSSRRAVRKFLEAIQEAAD